MSESLPRLFLATHLYTPASEYFTVCIVYDLLVVITMLSLWVMLKLGSGYPSELHLIVTAELN